MAFKEVPCTHIWCGRRKFNPHGRVVVCAVASRRHMRVCTQNDGEHLTSQNWSQALREAFAIVCCTAWNLFAEHLAVDCHIDPSGYLGVHLEVHRSLVLGQERRKSMVDSIRSRQPSGYSRTLLSALQEMLAFQAKPVDGGRALGGDLVLTSSSCASGGLATVVRRLALWLSLWEHCRQRAVLVS